MNWPTSVDVLLTGRTTTNTSHEGSLPCLVRLIGILLPLLTRSHFQARTSPTIRIH
jgi:hypothetical protein